MDDRVRGVWKTIVKGHKHPILLDFVKCKLAMSVHVGIGKCCHALLARPFFVWNVKLMMFRIVMVTNH
jgi:hypothetical protein